MPTAVCKLIELTESAAYKYDNSETPIIKTGVKAGKTAQEILEEYQPFKEQLSEIIAAAVPGVVPHEKDDEDMEAEKAPAAIAQPAPQCLTIFEEGFLEKFI